MHLNLLTLLIPNTSNINKSSTVNVYGAMWVWLYRVIH